MESIGSHLRRERELRQMSLEELAQTTRIPIRALQHLEEDRFEDLPGEVFVRGFMRSYARAVGISADDIVAEFDRGRIPVEPPPAPITAITAPERGRRFGIAIALVILLILFTLALSIVLRPRRHDTPVELSENEVHCPVRPDSPTPSYCAPSTTATPTASSRC